MAVPRPRTQIHPVMHPPQTLSPPRLPPVETGRREDAQKGNSYTLELQAYSRVGSVDSDVVVRCINDFCKDIDKKTVVVMDNSPIHTSETFQKNIPVWKDRGLDIFYLPKYSPELNCIEILWRFIKYEWIEFDAYKSWTHLVNYVENVLQNFGEKYKIIFG